MRDATPPPHGTQPAPTATAGPPPRQPALPRISPTTKVTLLTVVLATTAVAVLASAPRWPGAAVDWRLWLVFLGVFAVCEAAVFHLEIRREAHTFSLGEAAVVIGLSLVHPWLLASSRAIGASLAMAWRRVAPMKISFNAALAATEVAVAASITGLIAGTSEEPGLVMIGIVVGVATADVVGVFAVVCAIACFEGRPRRRQVLDVLTAQALVTTIAGSLGVLGALAIAADGWGAIYLTIVAIGLLVVFRQLATLTSRYSGLQTLHDFSRAIADDLDHDRVWQTAMSDLVDMLNATNVLTITLDPDQEPAIEIRTVAAAGVETSTVTLAAADWRSLRDLDAGTRDATELRAAVRSVFGLEAGQAMTTPLSLGEGRHVVLVATKSADAVSRFDAQSFSQFTAMARYMSATLKNVYMVAQLDHAARHDALTGLATREELERLIAEHQGRCPPAVAILAIDDFEAITDALGHRVGDEVVQELARRLRTEIGPEVFAMGRLDGAAFALALECLDPGDLRRRVDDLLVRLSGEVKTVASALNVECRAGLAEPTERDVGPADLLRRADLALSEARRTGVVVQTYSHELDRAQQRRVEVAIELRRGLGGEEFELHYQPKLSLASGELAGAEALIRWNHHALGMVRPDEFVDIAETTGVIGHITAWVIDEAVRQAAAWRRVGQHIEISVNLSAIDLLDDDLAAHLSTRLADAGIPASAIGLEVTETAVMQDRARAIVNLQQLRAHGHRIYLDDYGTGHSSLAYLQALPIDAIKIDRAFIESFGRDARNDAIVSSTIALGHQLGLEVVAEGIEDAVAFARLRDVGCEYVQGYFIAKPLPARAFESWLDDADSLRRLLGYPDDADGPATGTERADHAPAPRG